MPLNIRSEAVNQLAQKLAKSERTNKTRLFKGEDFLKTDIRRAPQHADKA